jgi:hypothetical protein
MEINVEVSGVTLDSLVREASDYGPGSTVADLLVQAVLQRLSAGGDVWSSIATRVALVQGEEIREHVRPLIAEALTRPLRHTNNYGEPTGPETTLRELILAEVRDMLTRPVNEHGVRTNLTVAGQIIQQQVRDAFRKEVAAEVARAKDRVAAEIGELVAVSVKEGLQRR